MSPVVGKKESVIPPEWLIEREIDYGRKNVNLNLRKASETRFLIDELPKLPNTISIDPIQDPSALDAENSAGEKTPILVDKAMPSREYSVEDPLMLQTVLPSIQMMFNQKNFNLTSYKANLWVEQMRLSQSVAFQLSLLIPDITRPPITNLTINEIPHLFVYLFAICVEAQPARTISSVSGCPSELAKNERPLCLNQ